MTAGVRAGSAGSAPVELDLSSGGLAIHLVGIGGAGMSSIASVLAAMGHRVSGSDIKESRVVQRLRAEGVHVEIGHRAENLPRRVDVVARSTAIRPGNVELQEADARGVPVLSRAELLAAVTKTRRTVAVAGTHGKTTTSSMVTLAFEAAGLRPAFVIGGELNEVGSGAGWSDGEWLVLEADESDGTFLMLDREIAVVTSVEADHLDFFGSEDAIRDAFREFLVDAEIAVVCIDDAGAASVAEGSGAITYGTAGAARVRAVEVATRGLGSRFTVSMEGGQTVDVELAVPGIHNVCNATAALACVAAAGGDVPAAAEGLKRFTGVARRFQFRGREAGVVFVDDYAHLPTEVRMTLEAARAGGWNRIVCAFQPHRYTRTASLWQTFAGAFDAADVVVVTDVYPAGEDPIPGVSGRLVFEAAGRNHPTGEVYYAQRRDELVEMLLGILRPGDVCLTLGAGDITELPDVLMARLGV
ncbi:MAG: UDP-N-acetylmuramate--L-alanine ligase [Acidimicrobiales bacterium]|nr:MAG: UDP-N-acetylmuramate--L-alanine ligase [Acidimicrobiales bacterium]